MSKSFKELVSSALAEHSEEIESVMLYTNFFKEKHLLLVFKDATHFSKVHRLKKIKLFKKHVCELKVFFYTEFLNALDVFPMEFMQLKEESALIMGRNVLEGLVISRDNLRHQCEFYLRSNLLSARENYLKQSLPDKEILKCSMNQLWSVLSIIYSLIGVEWEKSNDIISLCDAIEKSFSVDQGLYKIER